jgi:hypothetical protein
MASANLNLISALRKTAENLRNGAFYAWGNQGACNCGNLVQVITKFSKEQIIAYAQQTGLGEWTEMAEEYCSVSNAPKNMMVMALEEIGLSADDIHHLEYLSDNRVLKNLPGGFRFLQRNVREDVILYFETFANMLEESLLKEIELPKDLFTETKKVELV